MNNNRNNNRRRGRGNRQQGGGQQLNRIDSRARGNAPQLLEKYRKLAQDAHLNGDRVQAEYYLQFADHYFRVIADTRLRQEEQRARREDRWEGGDDQGDDAGEFSADTDFPTFDQPTYSRREREDRPRREDGDDDRRSDSRGEGRPNDGNRADPREADDGDAEASANPYEPAENPFVRDARGSGGRGLRPRRERHPANEDAQGDDAPAGLDPSSLPPSIKPAAETDEAGADAKPRRARPRRKPSADDAGESLESVG